jgi:tRNA nucleotidyltransferase (CCA-adding enzyme)
MMSKNMPKYLEECLPSNICELVSSIIKQASEDGIEIFIVGGAVRDLLLKRNISDLDLAVERDAESFARKVSQKCGANFTYHAKFKTAKLKFAGLSVDIITSRKETYKKPGALPTVQPGNITDDLLRRDFTINAMAMKLPAGEIIDPSSGRQDIKNRYIRVLHEKSFIDDATRIFRAIRYEQRLTFKIEPVTLNLLRHSLNMFETISDDRIRHELAIAMEEEYPELFFSRANELGVLIDVYHSLTWNEQLNLHFAEARKLTGRISLPEIYFCLLIYYLGLEDLRKFTDRYKFSKKLSAAMFDTIHLKIKLEKLVASDIKLSDVYRLLSPYASVSIQANLLSCGILKIKNLLSLYLSKLKSIKTYIRGADLIDIGIPSGPLMGEILNSLLNAKIDGAVKTRSEELNYLDRLIEKQK